MKTKITILVSSLGLLIRIISASAQDSADLSPIAPENATRVERVAELVGLDISDDSRLTPIAWSTDGETLAVVSEGQVWLYHAHDLQAEPRLLQDSNDVKSVAFSPDEEILASVGPTLQLWDVSTGELLRTLGTDNPLDLASVAFSYDGTMLALQSDDHAHSMSQVGLWDVATAEWLRVLEITECGFGNVGTSVSVFSPDGALLASACEGSSAIQLWDVATGELLRELDLYTAAMDSAETLLRLDGGAPGTWKSDDRIMRHYMSGRAALRLQYPDAVTSLQFSPNGQILAVGSAYAYVRLWAVATGETLHKLEDPSFILNSVSISPDGTVLASAGTTLTVWDVTTGDLLRVLSAGVDFVAFSPDGTLLESANYYQDTLTLWGVPITPSDVNASIGDVCRLTAFQNVNVRYFPSTDAGVNSSLSAGQSSDVNGQFVDEAGFIWWHLTSGGWVRSDVVDEISDCTGESTPLP